MAELLTGGKPQYNGPFQVLSGTGPKILLPNRYAQEVRNNPHLSLEKTFAKVGAMLSPGKETSHAHELQDLFVDYPGFEGHRVGLSGGSIIQDTVKSKLTPSLGLVMGDLVDESTVALQDVFSDVGKEFVTRTIRDDMEHLVARLTSRVFLGKELCRNERWLEISKSYTIDSVELSYLLRTVFTPLQPIAYWFFPQATRLRKAVRDAHDLIDPEVERRKAIVEAALEAGEKPPRVSDTLGWMYELSKGRQHTDYVAGQLTLAFASINNTVETLTAAMVDICEYPGVADQLREEIIEVISKGGWTKSSLYDLKLMDSFLKEGQRVHPFVSLSMQRYVEKEITLSDGTVLPKDSRIMIAGDFMEPGADVPGFDAARFMRLREHPGEEKNWQFVTTSPEHMGFGHGSHACPGRFLASNELKIALCHLLLKYDWRFIPGEGRRPPLTLEATNCLHRDVQIQLTKREPEIDLDSV